MGKFVVERYIPALTAEGVEAQIRSERLALDAAGAASDGVRHIRMTYLSGDELCFSLFEGPSIEVVRDVNQRAGLRFERVTEAIEVDLMEGE